MVERVPVDKVKRTVSLSRGADRMVRELFSAMIVGDVNPRSYSDALDAMLLRAVDPTLLDMVKEAMRHD